MELRLGDRRFDVTHRTLVMGILNRTPDSFYDAGSYYEFDRFLAQADRLVADGADFLDVGGVKAGPGPEVSVAEELERVVPAIEQLVARFDVPISVDTWNAAVLREALAAGAVVGNDISGFADPDYLPVCAAAGASVIACHIRLAPRIPDPDPQYGDVVAEVRAFLGERAQRALDAGIPADRIIVDAALDFGKTEPMSLELLQRSDELLELGYPVLAATSNKRFLGVMLDLAIDERQEASWAADALAVTRGCRILRAHDVRGARRVADTLEAVMTAP